MFATFLLLAMIVMAPSPGHEKPRPYHYERREIHIFDQRGVVRTVPTWKRVDD
jgi:hypothetical protein